MPDIRLLGFALAATFGLAGCASYNPNADTGMPPPVDCGAASLQDKVGQPVIGSTASDLRVGGQPVRTAGTVRVVRQGQPMTMDFRVDRLTIETDANANLVSARCV